MGQKEDLELVSDPPAGAAISDGSILDASPLHVVVADLCKVSVGLLPAGEHPTTAQVIHAEDALDVGHSLHRECILCKLFKVGACLSYSKF